jgi:hypothetical protein
MSEGMISALGVAAATGVLLTLLLAQAFGSVWIALWYSVPAALAVAGVLVLLESGKIAILDRFKLGGTKPPKEED